MGFITINGGCEMLEALGWIMVAAFAIFMTIVSLGCGLLVVMWISDKWEWWRYERTNSI